MKVTILFILLFFTKIFQPFFNHCFRLWFIKQGGGGKNNNQEITIHTFRQWNCSKNCLLVNPCGIIEKPKSPQTPSGSFGIMQMQRWFSVTVFLNCNLRPLRLNSNSHNQFLIAKSFLRTRKTHTHLAKVWFKGCRWRSPHAGLAEGGLSALSVSCRGNVGVCACCRGSCAEGRRGCRGLESS